MNATVERRIRQAELEFLLTRAWDKSGDRGHGVSFQEWLEYQIDPDRFYWKDEAKELIALYEA